MGFLTKTAVLVALIAYLFGCLHFAGPFDPWITRLTGRVIKPTIITNGTTAKGWEKVKELFDLHLEKGESLGSQLVILQNGKTMVDLYGSYGVEGYNDTSLQVIFSSTKTLEPVVIALLVEKGLLDYYSPISKYWPEFAQNGKENITLAELLRHEGGLDGLSKSIPWSVMINQNDPKEPMRKYLEESYPNWPVNTRRAYHSLTRGLILNTLVQQVDPKKRSLGKIFEEEVRKPLGIDCWIGLPKDKISRVHELFQVDFADMVAKLLVPNYIGTIDEELGNILKIFSDPKSRILTTLTITGPNGEPGLSPKFATSPEYSEALIMESPSTNGVCNARSLATVLAMLANKGEINGVRILTPETINKMQKISTSELIDEAMGLSTTFSDGGMGVNCMMKWAGFKSDWYGWGGWGGSISQYNPELNIAFAYTMTGMGHHLLGDREPRMRRIVKELVKIVE